MYLLDYRVVGTELVTKDLAAAKDIVFNGGHLRKLGHCKSRIPDISWGTAKILPIAFLSLTNVGLVTLPKVRVP